MTNSKNIPKRRFSGFDGKWEQEKFGKIATIINGRAYSQHELLSEGKYKVLRVGNFYTNESWYYSNLELDNKYYANNGDLLYTWSATFGPHIWSGDKVIYHYHIWKVELSERIDKKYILQLLEKDKSDILSNKNGSTMVHITKDGMENKLLMFPEEIEEQIKIGSFLKQLDQCITLHQHKLDKLKNLKKSYLAELFPAEGERVPKRRFPGFEGEWEKKKLGEIMDVGSVKRVHQSDWRVNGVRFLRARDIVSEFKNEVSNDYLYIDEELYKEYTTISGKVEKGDLLVTGVGTIGVPLLIKSDKPLYFKDGNIIWFKNKNKIDGYFFYYSFIGNTIQKFIGDVAGIGTVGTYTIDSGKNTPILLSKSKEEQILIGNFLKTLDNSITLQQQKLDKLKDLKKAYLNELFV